MALRATWPQDEQLQVSASLPRDSERRPLQAVGTGPQPASCPLVDSVMHQVILKEGAHMSVDKHNFKQSPVLCSVYNLQ